jgi:hypothetical protein
MLSSLVYLECHPRPFTLSLDRPVPTLSGRFRPGRKGLTSLQSVSPVILSTDHCPPTIEAWSGDPDLVGTAHYFSKSFSCNTYGSPRKCCKQKTYGQAKSFRCNTYKKQGASPPRRSDTRMLGISDVAAFRRLDVRPAPLQATFFGATIRKGTQFFTIRGNNSAPPGV